ncbi:hypothetical protein ILUMI_10347 [Ignelater luminosus]|uniref:Uncharacterized protein n=1 Tax=Ignelater luminosus TaxID=2038154 RepID=A0A8K0D7A5_IGNLU|nr:hypothetical protein ILUMI_10347 [Ignelater luminosus]
MELRKAITSECKKKHLKPNKLESEKEWMTDSIFELMEERRKYKAKDGNRYKQIHSEVRRRIQNDSQLNDFGIPIMDIKGKLKAWREYIRQPFEDERQRENTPVTV